MKNKVHVFQSDFKVYPEKGVVVCILKCDTNLYNSPAWVTSDSEWWMRKLPNVSCQGTFIVRAKAVCGKHDKFDETVGKRIAESRAKAKAYRVSSKLWNICFKKINELANFCAMREEACKEAQRKEAQHVIELCNS